MQEAEAIVNGNALCQPLPLRKRSLGRRKSQRTSPAELLVYRSNLLGADQRITNTGGGNTSAKLTGTRSTDWRAGRGVVGERVGRRSANQHAGEFRVAIAEAACAVCRRSIAKAEARGPKTPAEDRMVGLYPHCTFNLNPRASSIDTPLHSFVPAKHVDHMHPNSVIAIAASRRSKELTAKVFEGAIGWTPWLRPGFELGLEMERAASADPALKGLVMSQHGLINWADDGKECYDLTLRLIEQAAAFIEAHDKGEKTFGGSRYSALPDARTRRSAGRVIALVARASFAGEAVCRNPAIRRGDFALREQQRCAAAFRIGHVMSRSFSAHENQTSLCRLGSGDGRYRGSQEETGSWAWFSIERITRLTTNRASVRILRRCATRIRP